ncbi:MAG: 1-acyl-sn-glycerol-3-phosphate acyltransferase [Chitinophagaceae bacterium]|nr:1-acyl-sn-glycerol-3-phosphate acyltransferase [Chitinophagaceae bacterium]
MMSFVERIKNVRIFRKILYFFIGMLTYHRFAIINKLKISGTEHLNGLPRKNVLLVSNHQTYFADVIAILHILSAVKWGKKNRLGFPYYLLNAFTNIYYVAAEETMKATWLAKLFTLGGAITVKRTWTGKSTETRKGLDPSDTRKISRALEKNWIIQFPQGTTTPFAPGRKGTAHLIKMHRPVVVPVVIDGFSTAFDKKGIKLRKRGTVLSVTFKECLKVDYDAPIEVILDDVMTSIGQKRL